MARRRGNHEGSIYRRKDGLWAAQISLDMGRRKTLYGATRHEVSKKLIEGLHAASLGTFVRIQRQTVGQFLDQWLLQVIQTDRPALDLREL